MKPIKPVYCTICYDNASLRYDRGAGCNCPVMSAIPVDHDPKGALNAAIIAIRNYSKKQAKQHKFCYNNVKRGVFENV